jgi:hypothetical protein
MRLNKPASAASKSPNSPTKTPKKGKIIEKGVEYMKLFQKSISRMRVTHDE